MSVLQSVQTLFNEIMATNDITNQKALMHSLLDQILEGETQNWKLVCPDENSDIVVPCIVTSESLKNNRESIISSMVDIMLKNHSTCEIPFNNAVNSLRILFSPNVNSAKDTSVGLSEAMDFCRCNLSLIQSKMPDPYVLKPPTHG